ncbi:MAG: HD-GYP domain-containing protein [Mycobacteriales bacterium]
MASVTGRDRRVDVYVGAVLFAAVVCAVRAVPLVDDWLPVAYFAFLLVVTHTAGTRTDANLGVSLAFVVGMAAVLVLGPPGALLVGLSAVFVVRPLALVKRLFNAAMYGLAGLASAGGYAAVHGVVGHLSAADFPRVLLTSAIASSVYFVVNMALITGIMALISGNSLQHEWWGRFAWMTFNYLGYGLFGLLMAVLYYQGGVVVSVLVLLPLVVAREAFANYVRLQAAYESTVRSLVKAVETKDHYTRGHSERVARGSEMIARASGMREDRVTTIRYAGLLHDVGKLGVPTRVLQKTGRLDDGEFEAVQVHPGRGVEILRDIDFLREATQGVLHHHERMDGRGYPMGLAGYDIPEFARIICVADAFDSMTSTRSYSSAKPIPDAVAELRRCAGTQFDPVFVEAFIGALTATGWQLPTEPAPQPAFVPEPGIEPSSAAPAPGRLIEQPGAYDRAPRTSR